MKRAKVAHLTTVHMPGDTRVFHRQCKTLARAGYEVVLIAAGARDELVDGVRVRGVAGPGSRAERMTRIGWQLYQAAVEEQADVYHFHDPELMPVALLLKARTGAPVVYDAHEDYAQAIAGKDWIPAPLQGMAARLCGLLERRVARRLDRVVAATPAIGAKFPASHTLVVQNFALAGELEPADAGRYGDRAHLFVYAGRISRRRGAKEIVEAIGLLEANLEARLALAGMFVPPRIEEELARLEGWRLAEFAGWQSRPGLKELFARARAGLVVLHPVEQYVGAQPVKLFEYLAAGIPVIASDFPLWRAIVEGAGCGILVDPLSPRSIAAAMRWILEHPEEAELMGGRGREAVLKQYNWSGEAKKLLALYEELTRGRSGAAA